jgi:adenylate kinase family enzyme
MERVLVLGSPGAGKSTFARRLAERTGLPLIHLDRHFWRAGWTEPHPDAWRQQVAELARQPRWIMDGDYSRTLDIRLPRAETVVLLDTPRWLNVARVLKRVLKDYGRTRPDLADECPERFNWEFLQYVWSYPHKLKPRVAAMLEGYPGEIITLRNRRVIERYLTERVTGRR